MRMFCSILLFIAALGPAAGAQSVTVRLAVVPSPNETGLLRSLLPDFERQSGYRVTIYAGEDLFDVARAGGADLVIAHYGHHDTEAFMAQGLGLWPRTVFGNQIAILGPADDPARIRGLQDAGEAFRRIAAGPTTRFVANNSAILKYIESMLWEMAGRPAREPWFIDAGLSEAQGMERAARLRAYYLFAVPPFLRWQEACEERARRLGATRLPVLPLAPPQAAGDETLCEMEPLVLAGPMPHRIMVASIVNAQRVQGVDVAGAAALQEYLLRPAVQARIERFRDPRTSLQVWRAAGLHNSGAALGRRP